MTPSEFEYLDLKVRFLQDIIIMSAFHVDQIDISFVTVHIHGDN